MGSSPRARNRRGELGEDGEDAGLELELLWWPPRRRSEAVVAPRAPPARSFGGEGAGAPGIPFPAPARLEVDHGGDGDGGDLPVFCCCWCRSSETGPTNRSATGQDFGGKREEASPGVGRSGRSCTAKNDDGRNRRRTSVAALKSGVFRTSGAFLAVAVSWRRKGTSRRCRACC